MNNICIIRPGLTLIFALIFNLAQAKDNLKLSHTAIDAGINKLLRCVRDTVQSPKYQPFDHEYFPPPLMNNVEIREDEIDPTFLDQSYTLLVSLNYIKEYYHKQNDGQNIRDYYQMCATEYKWLKEIDDGRSRDITLEGITSYQASTIMKYFNYVSSHFSIPADKELVSMLQAFILPNFQCHMLSIEAAAALVLGGAGGADIGYCESTDGKLWPLIAGSHLVTGMGVGAQVSINLDQFEAFIKKNNQLQSREACGAHTINGTINLAVGTGVNLKNDCHNPNPIHVTGFRGLNVGAGVFIDLGGMGARASSRILPSVNNWEHIKKILGKI